MVNQMESIKEDKAKEARKIIEEYHSLKEFYPELAKDPTSLEHETAVAETILHVFEGSWDSEFSGGFMSVFYAASAGFEAGKQERERSDNQIRIIELGYLLFCEPDMDEITYNTIEKRIKYLENLSK
jgi:uncharacterized cupin superfamily protein